MLEAGVKGANAKLSRVEQIKKFTLLPTAWEPGGDELTPTMKLKRKPIAEKYASDEAVAMTDRIIDINLGVGVTAVLPGIVRTELSAGSKTPKLIALLSTVDPEDVASAMVAAVGTKRPVVTVPRRLGVMLKTMSLRPHRARMVADRLTGASTAYTQADPAAREAYNKRLRGQA